MSSARDDIAFLANSDNRVIVLRSLLDGPHSRHVIAEKTGASRVTLRRILDELEDRQWITQQGQICDITSLGAWVIEEFTALCTIMEAEGNLRQVYQWFPVEEYGFHIRCLADADITPVRRADASAPISTLSKQFQIGGRLYAFSFAITSQFLDACWHHVMAASVTWEWVFTSEVRKVLQNSSEMATKSREMLESGAAEYRQFDGPIPYVVIVSEEMVNLRLADNDGAATALIQSDNDHVRTWAESTFEEYWREATSIEPDVLTS